MNDKYEVCKNCNGKGNYLVLGIIDGETEECFECNGSGKVYIVRDK